MQAKFREFAVSHPVHPSSASLSEDVSSRRLKTRPIVSPGWNISEQEVLLKEFTMYHDVSMSLLLLSILFRVTRRRNLAGIAFRLEKVIYSSL